MSQTENEKNQDPSADSSISIDEEGLDEGGDWGEIEVNPELFVDQLLRFDCFKDARQENDPNKLFDIVFSAYQDEDLTEEQDHVVELLLHLQEEESPFNLNRALQVWSKDDLQTFLDLIKDAHLG